MKLQIMAVLLLFMFSVFITTESTQQVKYGMDCGTTQDQRVSRYGCSLYERRCWSWCHNKDTMAQTAQEAKGKWCYTTIYMTQQQKEDTIFRGMYECYFDSQCQNQKICHTDCNDSCYFKRERDPVVQLILKWFGYQQM